MIKTGLWQELEVEKFVDFGAYLGDGEEKVLLPKKQLKDEKIGDTVKVFVYKDSEDRLIATINRPKITLGEVKVLKVVQVTKIGAFLDWGLEKDLLLPFKEQIEKIEEGLSYPVALYVDKSGRLAATMWIDKYIKGDLEEKRKRAALFRMYADKENVFVKLERKGGSVNYTDKADAELIKKEFNMSKAAFKKAVGMLYKERRIEITENSITIL